MRVAAGNLRHFPQIRAMLLLQFTGFPTIHTTVLQNSVFTDPLSTEKEVHPIYLDFLLFLAHSQECCLHVNASEGSQGNCWQHHPLQIWDNPVPCLQCIKTTHSGPKEEHPATLRCLLPADSQSNAEEFPRHDKVWLLQGEEHHSRGGSLGWKEARRKIPDNFTCSLFPAL